MEYYSVIKKKHTGTCYNVNEPKKHYTKWKKPDPKCYMLCDSIYMKYTE